MKRAKDGESLSANRIEDKKNIRKEGEERRNGERRVRGEAKETIGGAEELCSRARGCPRESRGYF